MADNRPPKPFGRPYAPGDVYVDMVTGQSKQVQASGPDAVIQSSVAQQQEQNVATPDRTSGVYGEYEAATAELESANQLLSRAEAARAEFGSGGVGQAPKTQVIFNEQTYNLAGIDKEIARIKKLQKRAQARFDAAKKVIKPLEDKVNKIRKQIDAAGDNKEREAKWTAQLPAAEAALENAKAIPAGTKLTPATVKDATKPGKPGAAATTTTPRGPTPGSTAQLRMIEESQRGTPIGKAPGTTKPVSTGKGKNVGLDVVKEDQTKVEEGKTKKPEDPFGGLDIESLKRDYPGFAWIFDLAPEFNDTKKLWADYLSGNIEQERFNNLLGQTSWYTNRNTIKETRRIKNRYGDLLDSGTLGRLVNDSINFVYDDQELDNAFFGAALARNVMTGNFIDSRAANAVMSSNTANKYRNYAKSMFLTADDKEIEDLLTGKLTEQDFTNGKRQIAKNVYKNWAPLLDDPTLTMEQIVKPWKDMAANVLELTPDQVDMTKPQYSVAYAGSPDGKMGAMSLGEWYIKLRSDSQYGWDKTTQAKQEAQELGYSIARAFGRVG